MSTNSSQAKMIRGGPAAVFLGNHPLMLRAAQILNKNAWSAQDSGPFPIKAAQASNKNTLSAQDSSEFPSFKPTPSDLNLVKVSSANREAAIFLEDMQSACVLHNVLSHGARELTIFHKGKSISICQPENIGAEESANNILSLFSAEQIAKYPLLQKLFIEPAGFVAYSNPERHGEESVSLISMPFDSDKAVQYTNSRAVDWAAMSHHHRMLMLKELVSMLSELHSDYGLLAGNIGISQIMLNSEGEPVLNPAHIQAAHSKAHGVPEALILLCQFHSRGLISRDDVSSLLNIYLNATPKARCHVKSFLEHRSKASLEREGSIRKYVYMAHRPLEGELMQWFDYYLSSPFFPGLQEGRN